MEQRLKDWQRDLSQLQEDYDKLLFFRMPKILRLHRILMMAKTDIKLKEILQEVNFLFTSLSTTRDQITTALNVSSTSYYMNLRICLYVYYINVINVCTYVYTYCMYVLIIRM